jgi:alcohol oxidase
METYQVANDLPTHGYSGPLKVSLGNDISNVAHKFLEMAASYDKERESSNTADANELSANSINKYTVMFRPALSTS